MKKIKRIALAILVVYLITIVILTLAIKLFTKDVDKTPLQADTEVLTVDLVKYTSQEENTVGQAYTGKLCGLETVTCKSEKTCELDEVSCLIKAKAEEYGIDWKIAVAISWHETGRYTSYNYLNKNNVGGTCYLGVVMTFNSLEEGIDYFISNLKRNYFDKGLTTLELIQPIYCPIGAKNDPKKLNQYWLSGTTRMYESLEV